jgi:hypothetical protein
MPRNSLRHSVRPEPVEGRSLQDNGHSCCDEVSINGLSIYKMNGTHIDCRVPTRVDIARIEKLLGLIQPGKKYSPRGFLPSWPGAVGSSVAP